MNRNHRAGFTLVELVVVFAVVAILLGMSAPALLSSIPDMRVSGAARQVLSDMRLARTRAIEQGVSVVVEFDSPATTHYRLFFDDNGDGAYTAADDELISQASLNVEYEAISLKSNDGSAPADGVDLNGTGSNSIAFRPNGAASGSGSVYLMPTADAGGSRHDRNRRVRVVGSTGNVRIETFDGSTWQ